MAITSSWRRRVEKGLRTDNQNDAYDATRYDNTTISVGIDDSKSTGKGGKKRRAAIAGEEASDADESDDEDDRR